MNICRVAIQSGECDVAAVMLIPDSAKPALDEWADDRKASKEYRDFREAISDAKPKLPLSNA